MFQNFGEENKTFESLDLISLDKESDEPSALHDKAPTIEIENIECEEVESAQEPDEGIVRKVSKVPTKFVRQGSNALSYESRFLNIL